jgi:beta-glucosidase/6-phospho-beta-glucosidase/beta-galactosidase
VPPPAPPARSSQPFVWATGIEDTFISAPWPATGRTLDEYELTQHYEQWEADLSRVAGLGVAAARYGIPWYRVNPRPGVFNWDWAERALDRLLALGVRPIVDLVHYGTPAWLEGAFAHPDYPQRVADYAGQVAARFADRISWYTPLNEPRITAWYCGRVGLWPPNLRGWRGFLRVMLALGRGICETVAAIQAAVPGPTFVHADATDLYVTPDPTLAAEARRRQLIGFLALDLVTGRVEPGHELWPWARHYGMSEGDAAWFGNHRITLDVCGLNMYPMFSLKRLVRHGTLRQQMPYAAPEVLEQLVEQYWERYQAPLMITETAARGPHAHRARWMDASIEAVRRLRARGIPLVGYTWWPLFALVSWPYRTGHRPLAAYLEQMGLWDLHPEPDGSLRRVRTPLVDRYRDHLRHGIE